MIKRNTGKKSNIAEYSSLSTKISPNNLKIKFVFAYLYAVHGIVFYNYLHQYQFLNTNYNEITKVKAFMGVIYNSYVFVKGKGDFYPNELRNQEKTVWQILKKTGEMNIAHKPKKGPSQE